MLECPECGDLAPKESIEQWGMCHDCDNHMCPECGSIDPKCGCDD
jgi:hypothetical protein